MAKKNTHTVTIYLHTELNGYFDFSGTYEEVVAIRARYINRGVAVSGVREINPK